MFMTYSSHVHMFHMFPQEQKSPISIVSSIIILQFLGLPHMIIVSSQTSRMVPPPPQAPRWPHPFFFAAALHTGEVTGCLLEHGIKATQKAQHVPVPRRGKVEDSKGSNMGYMMYKYIYNYINISLFVFGIFFEVVQAPFPDCCS